MEHFTRTTINKLKVQIVDWILWIAIQTYRVSSDNFKLDRQEESSMQMLMLNSKHKMDNVSNLWSRNKCKSINNKQKKERQVMANKFLWMILVVVLNMYNNIFYNNNKIRTKLFILHRLMLLLIMLKNIRMELTR
jgi:hypothetical protein